MGCCMSFCWKKSALELQDTLPLGNVAGNVKLFSHLELSSATRDFWQGNKIGEGGFGSVFKGELEDGTKVAVKVLSSHSSQGAREFLSEITAISDIVHENLVKLHGVCIEGNCRMLVYNYLENNSLAQTLLGANRSNIQFSWRTRYKICIGIARGLAFLHEEVVPHIVHRDIKASNILLDKDLTPKISDFGLAKLLPPNATHISTRVAGTAGYLAPEYALRGQVTRKSDIYSFGVLLLEIVSGQCNTNAKLRHGEKFLLDKAWALYEQGELERIVDMTTWPDLDTKEACGFLKVGLLCTQDAALRRPPMTDVVKMLSGEMNVESMSVTKPGLIANFMEMKARKNKNDLTTASSSLSTSSSNQETCSNTTYGSMTFTAIDDRE